jgi:phosphoribosylformimino-5-aminoimidazole carboxamide ribotide isomerase
VFNCGASQVTIGSVAITHPDLFYKWLTKYGSEKLILGADVKNNKIAVSGWLDISKVHLFDFVNNYKTKGIKYIICTDISKDGMLQGTAINLYKELRQRYPDLNIIASGGISDIKEIVELDDIGIFGIIIGKALYEGKIKITDLKRFL